MTSAHYSLRGRVYGARPKASDQCLEGVPYHSKCMILRGWQAISHQEQDQFIHPSSTQRLSLLELPVKHCNSTI
jgi:hypothetical protein